MSSEESCSLVIELSYVLYRAPTEGWSGAVGIFDNLDWQEAPMM